MTSELDVPLPAGYEDTYRRDFPRDLEDDPGTLRWFGEPWPSAARPAPVCRPDAHIPTPLGRRCYYCSEEITRADSGVRIPHFGFGDVPGMQASYCYYGIRCWLRSLGIGPSEDET